ncbi:RNA-dependent RNA polymerase protein [Yaba-7 virus]|uniref:RNA-directed RNA polymerase L n=1 Tax=Yaba-7 virus TaxID=159137 RepID=A0A346JF10_9VIRU|nr:RNA-dependent RNA polymerase protein [Yaba-7 virus]AXP32085.1 RNA-dependent RNA polymerase protein [Yaba-7 virus]
MDNQKINQYRLRINDAVEPETAKDILADLLMERHDYFGRELCYYLDIEYRNDIPIDDILLDFLPIGTEFKARYCTPDNFIIHNGKLFVLDYKVAVDNDSSTKTFEKYDKIFGDILTPLGFDYEIVIVRADPVRDVIHVNSDEFLQLFGPININLDFTWFYNLRALIYDKFKDDERFLEIASQGEFTMTGPWIDEETPELYDHPIFIEFYSSLDDNAKATFQKSINFDATKGDKWNQNLVDIIHQYSSRYEQFIKTASSGIFKCNGQYPKPSNAEITQGWQMMTERVSNERDITEDINKQKPSIHFIWSPPDESSNDNTKKLIKLAKLMQNIEGTSTYIDAFKSIGYLMDFSSNIGLYESYTSKLKNMARQTSKKIDNKIEPIKIGTATILWEQQFMFDSSIISQASKSKLFKEFIGIGGHKQFASKTLDDIDVSKPVILDFNNKNIIDKCKFQYNNVKKILSSRSDLLKMGCYLEEYGPKICESSPETWEALKDICSMSYWSAVKDFSTLMKNMLAVSQYNRHNTFRVVTCANNNLFGVVMPSSDIKTKRATLAYFVICVHNKKEEIMHHGALHATFRSSGKYVSISKGMRLDKERCQRIVSAPGLFLLTTLLMHNNNPEIRLEDVANFAFHTSLSITKAMLSLTEPSRYMIMNSLAISSHVKEYIAEKFSPYTKTSFSVIMANLIKQGCYNAYKQRSKVDLRSIHLTDYEITQKGVNNNRDLTSIWFDGKVSLKEYINQIYMPFYFNSKGLHEKHHVMIDLAKTVLEIERDQRLNIPGIWSDIPTKQTVNLPILIYSISKNLLMDTSRHNYIRSRIENSNNLKRSITTISTFTSSKSCIKTGDFTDYKSKEARLVSNKIEKDIKKYTIANPEFVDDLTEKASIRHATYDDVRKAVPNYIDIMSTKVFDALYTKIKTREISDDPTVGHILQVMKDHKQFVFTYFNKGQKTAKDREIFVGEFEAKMCLYLVERISKERCKLNPDEMISEPGDGKLKKLEDLAENEIRYTANTLKSMKDKALKEFGQLADQINYKPHSTKIEINADMSKWSAQDVLFKYFWLFALDPALYKPEKERILYFLCNYMQKVLVLPDEVIMSVLDQRLKYDSDIIYEMTNGLNQNWVEIKRNWLQGNLNYTSSYLHSCCMNVYKDIIKNVSTLLEGDVLVNSMVHSDDNHTSITMIQDKFDDDIIIEYCIKLFEKICLTFGNQANMKKTYVTNFIKEFVSLFNIYGEPFSVYGRFLLTAVGDCAFLGPYEDAASRISATQTAIKHGAQPSLAWVSIALTQWVTHNTYNMLPGQNNDPLAILPTHNRFEIPIELCGLLETELPTLAIAGMEAGNLTYLVNLSRRMSKIQLVRESIQSQYSDIEAWDLGKLTQIDLFRLKLLRYMTLDSSMTSDDGMGETSDMRSRSLLTPRKFTTHASLIRLQSYNDFQNLVQNQEEVEELFDYFIRSPQLLVTKGETTEEFVHSILFRYNSRKFKESLSIQNPSQLFIEQVLFANKPMIDYTSIHDRLFGLQDDPNIDDCTTIIGKKTFLETYRQIQLDIDKFDLSVEDIKTIYAFCIMNDPILVACANNILLSMHGVQMDRNGMTCCMMPEIKSLKVIYHSPALVLRAYVQNKPDVKGADPDEMQRDLFHLEEFINKTKLRESMQRRISKNETKLMKRDLKFEIQELTKFYQICYDYIKSTEHKIKVFILPKRAHTPMDFCGMITGNMLKDHCWFTIHYLKQITVPARKAQIATSLDLEIQISYEALRLVAHFADTFIAEGSRVSFLKRIISDFTYKGVSMEVLYSKIKSSRMRTKILPILFYLGDLEQIDIDRYDAEKADEQITWNNWQVSREFTTGPIDLAIKGYGRSIRIVGEDTKLTAAELQINKVRNDIISRHGQSLLNKPHGLKFERMEEVEFLDEKLHYIVYQLRDRKRYFYNILSTNAIYEHNTKLDQTRSKRNNRWIPVCPVAVSRYMNTDRPVLSRIEMLNIENTRLTSLQVAVNDTSMVRKAALAKMSFFDGPPIQCGGIDLSKLMQNQTIINLDINRISSISLLDLCRIFSCRGFSNDQDAFEFLSDEVMNEDISEELDSSPLLRITYTKKSSSQNTFKNAITKALIRECDKFEEIFDISGDGFSSDTNLELLENLVWILDHLKTNQWSSELKECIHMCLYRNNMDFIYHNFQIPEVFVDNPINLQVKWLDVIEFLEMILSHHFVCEPWISIMDHSISKAIDYARLEHKKSANQNTISKFIKGKKMGGRSKFDF